MKILIDVHSKLELAIKTLIDLARKHNRISIASAISLAMLTVAGDYSPDTYANISVTKTTAAISKASTASTTINIIAEKKSAALPIILSGRDRETYKKVFDLQTKHQYDAAAEEMDNINNNVLKGYVLAAQYTAPAAKNDIDDLVTWLDKYSDLPQYSTIYSKAEAIDADAVADYEKAPIKGLSGYGDNNGLSGKLTKSIDKQNWGNRTKAKQAWKNMQKYLSEGSISKAEKMITSPRVQLVFEPVEIDVALWNIAANYLYNGDASKALSLAKQSAKRSGQQIPGVYWVAGLAAWKTGNTSQAAEYFSNLAQANVSTWEQSAGAFWAYRSYSKLGRRSTANTMLEVAARHPYTFYGLLARKSLDDSTPFDWQKDALTNSDMRKLSQIPAIARAMALNEIGRTKDAETEIRRYYPTASVEEKKKMVLLAEKMAMPALQVRMAKVLKSDDDSHDYANYPIPQWKPKGGYVVEPALLFALMRHESGFNPNAKSRVGAVGLMQVMPTTAKYIAEKNNLNYTKEALKDPEFNLTVAQEYVQHLLSLDSVDGNMLYFAAAYNAGPGNLDKWKDSVEYKNDPLLFVETLPSKETRNFIAQVMTNYWIYSERLDDKGVASIKSVLDGNWPKYAGSTTKAKTYLAQVSQ